MKPMFDAHPGYKFVEADNCLYHVPINIPDEMAPAWCKRELAAQQSKLLREQEAMKRFKHMFDQGEHEPSGFWNGVYSFTAQTALVFTFIILSSALSLISVMLIAGKYAILLSLASALFH